MKKSKKLLLTVLILGLIAVFCPDKLYAALVGLIMLIVFTSAIKGLVKFVIIVGLLIVAAGLFFVTR